MRVVLRNIREFLLSLFANLAFGVFRSINLLWLGRSVTSLTLDKIWSHTLKVRIKQKTYLFHTPNLLTDYRARSILTKEPDTISWIDAFPSDSVFWDIGANVGTFTIYAGEKNLQVVAVEPSYLNLDLLARNVISNQLSQNVTIIPFGVGQSTSLQKLYLSSKQLTWGGAHNSLGLNIGFDGKPLQDPAILNSMSFSIDDLVEMLGIKSPTHIKIDVDGLEAEVLQGCTNCLKHVKSILIEVDRDYIKQKEEIVRILTNNNFKLFEDFDSSLSTSNQIWKNTRFF